MPGLIDRAASSATIIFALAMMAYGVICWTYPVVAPANVDVLSIVAVWPLAPPPVAVALSLAAGAILIAGGAAVLVPAFRERGGLALATLWIVYFLFLHGPRFVTPRNPGVWTASFEALAMAGAALALVPASPFKARLARFCYGVGLPVYGIQHFMYVDFVATLVPAWIPARLFWAWFTGIAHCAAGAAIVTGILGRTAALLAGLMFGSWVFIVHVPLVVATPGFRPGWTSLFTAMGMWSGGWLVAATFAPERVRARGESDLRISA